MRYKLSVIPILTFLLLTGCSIKDYRQATTTITNYLNSCNQGTRYEIYDLNKDGNIEILTVSSDSHADGITICSLDATSQEITILGTYGSFGNIQIYPESGFIEDYYLGQGIEESKIYEITDNNVKIVEEFWTNDGTLADSYEYKVNGKDVSKEEYAQALDKYLSQEHISIGYSDFTEYISYENNYEDIYESLKNVTTVQ